VLIVSANDARWLTPCLQSVYGHAGQLDLEVLVVENACTDGTRELVEASFPAVTVVSSPNRGFAYGNNRGLEHVDARYVLLLNPDTEILHGELAELIALLDRTPEIGLAGVRQIDGDDAPLPTLRRDPSVARALGEALRCEHWPLHPAWAGERVLDPAAYREAGAHDWIAGSFMLIRREALRAAGWLDERFFLYSEETDLCLRIRRAGFGVWHLPQMTIRHHAGKGGVQPALVAQSAFSRRLYAEKHLSAPRRRLYLAAVGLRHALDLAGAGLARLLPGQDAVALATRRAAARSALRALRRDAQPPFVVPPSTALEPASGPRADALFV
jgi:N-acetylglucosaminyl-diphospho-decaprenol L-rhamnosyltransferase